jgi:hypothetical protein
MLEVEEIGITYPNGFAGTDFALPKIEQGRATLLSQQGTALQCQMRHGKTFFHAGNQEQKKKKH